MRDKTLSHSHPSGESFSPEDVRFALGAELRELRAVGIGLNGERWLYRLCPSGGPITNAQLKKRGMGSQCKPARAAAKGRDQPARMEARTHEALAGKACKCYRLPENCTAMIRELLEPLRDPKTGKIVIRDKAARPRRQRKNRGAKSAKTRD